MGTKCWPGFQISPINANQCVPDCPTQKGFELQVKNGVPACVYTTQPDVYFSLKNLPALTDGQLRDIPSPEAIPRDNWRFWDTYNAVMDAYTKDSAIAISKIDKDKQLTDAFAALQTAENVRDKSPEAYQEARIRYYTLKNGESWVAEEQQRIQNGEAREKAEAYVSEYTNLARREQQQTKTMDVVNAVKDNILSMKDDFELTTGAFAKQLTDLKNQIQMERKKGAIQTASVLTWVSTLLNVILVLVLIVAVVLLIRKVTKTPTYTPTPSTS